MSWRFVTPVIALLACGNDKSKLDSSGPVFAPSIANALRAIAPDCKLEKTPTRQTRDCTGRTGSVKMELGEGDHFSRLTIGLKSMILPEAKAILGPPLQAVVGAPARDQVLEAVSKLESGQNADVTVTGAQIAVSASGSRAMPEYKVAISW